MDTEPTLNADFEPELSASLVLYDKAQPTFRVSQMAKPHVSIRVEQLRIVAWTPETLRRFAHVCLDAADALEDELTPRPSRPLAMGRMA